MALIDERTYDNAEDNDYNAYGRADDNDNIDVIAQGLGIHFPGGGVMRLYPNNLWSINPKKYSSAMEELLAKVRLIPLWSTGTKPLTQPLVSTLALKPGHSRVLNKFFSNVSLDIARLFRRIIILEDKITSYSNQRSVNKRHLLQQAKVLNEHVKRSKLLMGNSNYVRRQEFNAQGGTGTTYKDVQVSGGALRLAKTSVGAAKPFTLESVDRNIDIPDFIDVTPGLKHGPISDWDNPLITDNEEELWDNINPELSAYYRIEDSRLVLDMRDVEEGRLRSDTTSFGYIIPGDAHGYSVVQWSNKNEIVTQSAKTNVNETNSVIFTMVCKLTKPEMINNIRFESATPLIINLLEIETGTTSIVPNLKFTETTTETLVTYDLEFPAQMATRVKLTLQIPNPEIIPVRIDRQVTCIKLRGATEVLEYVRVFKEHGISSMNESSNVSMRPNKIGIK